MVNAAEQYRRSLKKELRCNSNAKDRLLKDFDKALTNFLDENTDPSMDDLVCAFGPVEEVAETLRDAITPLERTQYERNLLFTKVLTGILAIFLALFTISPFHTKLIP